jgi:hypothetical protein
MNSGCASQTHVGSPIAKNFGKSVGAVVESEANGNLTTDDLTFQPPFFGFGVLVGKVSTAYTPIRRGATPLSRNATSQK